MRPKRGEHHACQSAKFKAVGTHPTCPHCGKPTFLANLCFVKHQPLYAFAARRALAPVAFGLMSDRTWPRTAKKRLNQSFFARVLAGSNWFVRCDKGASLPRSLVSYCGFFIRLFQLLCSARHVPYSKQREQQPFRSKSWSSYASSCLCGEAEDPCMPHVPLGCYGSSFVRCLCSSPFVCDCYQCVPGLHG